MMIHLLVTSKDMKVVPACSSLPLFLSNHFVRIEIGKVGKNVLVKNNQEFKLMVLQTENEAKTTSLLIIFWGACIFQTAGPDLMSPERLEAET